MSLKVVVGDHKEFDLKELNKSVFLDDQQQDYSISQINPDHFILIYKNKAYDIRVLGHQQSNLTLNINGYDLNISIKDHISQILEKLGMDLDTQEVIEGIDAPMPGAILEVAVKEGDEVKKGDTLLILEAMKMENVIKAPTDCTVTAVAIKPGDNVEKNQRLLSF